MCLLLACYKLIVFYTCMRVHVCRVSIDNAVKLSNLWQENSIQTLEEARGFTVLNNTSPYFLKQPHLRIKRTETVEHYFKDVDDDFFRILSVAIFNYCSDAQFCTVSAPREVSPADKHFRCCFICTCDRNCARTGTCCPDIQTSSDKAYEDVIKTDKDVECKLFEFSNTERAYRFAVSCPANADSDAREKCANPGTLDVDRVPVFDKIGQLNYQNRFCAACHGVLTERLIWWIAAFSYDEKVSTTEHRETSSDNELEKGDLERELRPPEVEGVNLTVCYRDVINTCNVTGQWESYDEYLYQGCNSLQLFHRLFHNKVDRYFKNIFCALCNGFGILRSTCPLTGDKASLIDNVGFQYLISHTISDTGTQVDRRICGRTYQFDPLNNACRRFHCAFPTLADEIQMKCQDIAYILQSLYSIPVLVKFDDVIDSSQAEEIRNAIWYHVLGIAPDEVVGIEQMEMHFETNIPLADFLRRIEENSINLDRVQVKEFAMHILVYERSLQRMLKRPKNRYHGFKKKIHSTEFQFQIAGAPKLPATVHFARLRRLYADAWNLFPPNSSYSIPLVNTDDNSIQYIHENLYNGNAVLGIIPRLPDEGMERPSFETPHAYSKNFLGCPAFVYELKDHGFIRIPSGIMINGSDPVMFNFTEFTSINETHVRICVDSVQQKIPVSAANSVAMVITTNMVLIYLFYLETCV